MNLKTKVAGYYKLQVIRPDGTVRESGEFPNLITNIGLDRMATGAYLSHCQVGSGSTAPTVGDTALDSRVAGTSTKVASDAGQTTSDPYYAWAVNQWRFPAGSATGNISEVGVGWESTGNLFSRALVLDGGGSPTTITVLADEVLDVTYELRYYVTTADATGDVTFTGNLAGTYDWIFRASQIGTTLWQTASGQSMMFNGGLNRTPVYNGDIGPVTSAPSGSYDNTVPWVAQAYTNGNYYADFTMSLTTAQGNLTGGIRSVRPRMGIGEFQIQFDPPIPKTASDALSVTFRHSWGRV